MRFALPLVLLSALLLAAACSSSDEFVSVSITGTIPWSGPQTAKYRVLDNNDKDVGTLDLSIENAAAGQLLFHQYFDFPDKKFTNEAKVTVDATTLLPAVSTYKIIGPNGNLDCTATYDSSGSVKSHRIGEDGERTDTVSIPKISYDTWGDLFLWRTLDLNKGLDLAYTDVLGCTLAKPDTISVKLKVNDQESITVPAGTFDTWKLEIESGGDSQTAWYSTDPKHTLIRYDNGDSKFELTQAP